MRTLEMWIDLHYKALVETSETLVATVQLQGQLVKSIDLVVQGNSKLPMDLTAKELLSELTVAEEATKDALARHKGSFSNLLPFAPPAAEFDIGTPKIFFGGDDGDENAGDDGTIEHVDSGYSGESRRSKSESALAGLYKRGLKGGETRNATPGVEAHRPRSP